MAARKRPGKSLAEAPRPVLAMTVQRRAVLEALAARADHPTADVLYADVARRMPEISRTTVYRVLEALVDAGLAVRVSHLGSAARYDAITERHHHLVCVRCEKLVDLVDARLDRLQWPEAPPGGFEIQDYSIHFRGLCADCRSGRDPKARPARGPRPRRTH